MAEILIPQNDARVQYTAAGGETSFAYDFPVFDEDHVVVVETDDNGDDTTLTIGTHYTVTDVGVLAGGDIELVTAATADYIYTIYRDVPEERNSDFQQTGDFNAVTINRELDLQTMMMQQLRRDFDRTARLPDTVLSAVSALLPEPQADLLLGWAADGLSLENKADIGTQTVSGYMATLLSSASEAALKTAMNAESGVDYNELLSTISQAEIEAGTATTRRVVTAQRVAQAILAQTSLPRSYLAGLGLSNNGTDGDHDIDVAAGECRGADDDEDIVLSAITKRIDATWSAGTGNGGLSSSLSAPAVDTWYHVFAINVGGASDVGFDTSLTAANLVADHSATAYRRLGSVLTDGSANIIAFSQEGDDFLWLDPPLDVAVTDQGTTAVLRTLSVPPDVKVIAKINLGFDGAAVNGRIYVSSPDANDEAASPTNAPLGTMQNSSTIASAGYAQVRTNASSQVRTVAENASQDFDLATLGWIDTRGRND